MDGLNKQEEALLQQRLQKRQMKEFLTVYSNLVDTCFSSCVDDFTSRTLATRESGCISRCIQKQMAAQQRVGERFQELNAEMTAKMQSQ